MTKTLYQLLLSLKLGDGAFINQRKVNKPTYYLTTRSIHKDYINYKNKILLDNNIFTKEFIGKSGYNSNKVQYGLRTRVEPEITLVGRMSVDEILDELDLYGLCLFYLDDGTLHKNKHFMHISCNSFTYDETQHLIDIIYELFPSKKCSFRLDRKKDGREFPYVYIPVCVAREFSCYVRDLLMTNNIDGLLYKTIPPSQTIEIID